MTLFKGIRNDMCVETEVRNLSNEFLFFFFNIKNYNFQIDQ